MSNPLVTSILEDLAAGRITSAEAARLLDAVNSQSGASATEQGAGPAADAENGRPQYATYARESFRGEDDAQDPAPTEKVSNLPPPDRGAVNGIERVSVRAVGRLVRLVGDTRISTVSVDGPHVLRRNGSVLEVTCEGEIGPSLDGFSFIRPPRNLDDIRALGLGKALVVRINPKLIADIEVTAGSLKTENVPWLGKVRLTAGSATVKGVAEAQDVLVQAGQAVIEGAITTGRSRVRCESGSLVVRLADDSNVTVSTDSQLGRITWAGRHSGSGDEVVMGNGAARLEVSVVMGHGQVRVGSDPEETQQ